MSPPSGAQCSQRILVCMQTQRSEKGSSHYLEPSGQYHHHLLAFREREGICTTWELARMVLECALDVTRGADGLDKWIQHRDCGYPAMGCGSGTGAAVSLWRHLQSMLEGQE
eukprot:6484031-Amphidinium_carterae.1